MDFKKIFERALKYPMNIKLITMIFLFSFTVSISTTYFLLYTSYSNIYLMLVPVWIFSFFVGNFLAAFYIFDSSKYFPKMKYNNLNKSFEYAKKMYLPLIGTELLVSVLFFATFFVFGGFSVIENFGVFPMITLPSEALGEEIVFSSGVIPAFIASIIMGFFLIFSPIICVLKKKPPIESVMGSIRLVAERKAQVFFLVLTVLIISFIISFFGGIPAYLYGIFNEGYSVISPIGLALNSIDIFFGAYVGIFTYSAQVNYFISLKKGNKRKK